jgi:hypothetical protein
MAVKLIYIDDSGVSHELEALTTSAGTADAGKLFAPGPDGRWHLSLMPVGIGPATKSVVASEALTAPCLVNLWNDGGTLKMRYADASAAGAAKQAHGFLLASVAVNAAGNVYFEGEITGLVGLTPGVSYYLSEASPGAASASIVTAAGRILQYIGVAVGTTSIDFEPSRPIIRA